MMWKNFAVIVFSIWCIQNSSTARLETSNDDSVIQAIQEGSNLVILFAKKNSEKYQQSLAAISEDITSSLDAKIYKLVDSQLQKLYDNRKLDSALVFIRRGVPLLYTSEDNPEIIYEFFSDNRDPIVKKLDDSNFEHLTQASTGSTTGDWLVFFYDNQCVDCMRLAALWESVGATLKNRLNVARVNRMKAVQTSKRFKIQSGSTPEIILISSRLRKFFRYNLVNRYDLESFTGFAVSWHTKLTPEKIVTPATPFENLVDMIVQKLKELPSASGIMNDMTLLVIVSGILVAFFVFLMLRSKSAKPEETASKPAKPGKTKKEK